MRVLVTGAGGQLGRDVVAVLRNEPLTPAAPGCWWGQHRAGHHNIDVLGATHQDLAVENRMAVLDVVDAVRPDVIIHVAACTAVDSCEQDPQTAYAVNAVGTRNVVEAAARAESHMLYVSTDYVFDGRLQRPYHEWDAPQPLSVYGASKRGGEMECPPGSTIVRTAWLWGTRGTNIVSTALRLAAAGGPMRFVDDQRGSPTFTVDLAQALSALALDRRPGVFHVTNQGVATWYGFVRAVLEVAGYDPQMVQPIATGELVPPRAAPRPENSVLDNAALRAAGLPLLPDWRDAVRRGVPIAELERRARGPTQVSAGDGGRP